ncbi:MAG TPA: hypothetical protein VJ698_13315 [Noviherbaspirillum sp.]|uniref:hypothetical protein n=1 Tax=Noviherbaspirillum sp. TaxID=1926288 RepID=UPI002B46EDA7|nr:hypothetical protein [Noviherbaspirillum sp.]HJV86447.1 hypothetical protein [Noviherbaspirillum sp.]
MLPLLDGDAAEELVPGLVGSVLDGDDDMPDDDVDDGEVALLPLPVDCANAMDDTDAIMTNDSDRIVGFSLIGNSFS